MKKNNAYRETMPLIGVIGGVGPYAGLDFMRNIFINTQAKHDQDHLNCMLISCPSIIPDRTNFLLQNNDVPDKNPALGMFESARRLYAAGAQYAAVACNTAHADRIFTPFCNMVYTSFPELKIVNMLETCADYVKTSLGINRLGLLATKGTYKSQVYHEYFRAEEGFVLIEPDPPDMEKIHDAIYNEDFGIKAHSQPIAGYVQDIIQPSIYRLIDSGAEGIILGCTELPLSVKAQDFSIPIIDPGILTARRLIALTAPEKLACEGA
ncbi:MAG: amino acid racemase [Treponema sp.]|jgi:aspartate racemase|nr:amino acid racemase [Treponema sp.]